MIYINGIALGVLELKRSTVSVAEGIIWHTQGSGKSLTMVWLAKWIRENLEGARVLIITDRTELDEQIKTVFKGVNEQVYRATSGDDLIEKLNGTEESLLCSLVHKFGRQGDDEEGPKEFIAAIQKLPPDFKAGRLPNNSLKPLHCNGLSFHYLRVTPIVTPFRRTLPFFRRAASADFHHRLTTGNAG